MSEPTFREVSRQWLRMCLAYPGCHDCPLGNCVLLVFHEREHETADIERIVMGWAETHPEDDGRKD